MLVSPPLAPLAENTLAKGLFQILWLVCVFLCVCVFVCMCVCMCVCARVYLCVYLSDRKFLFFYQVTMHFCDIIALDMNKQKCIKSVLCFAGTWIPITLELKKMKFRDLHSGI